MKHEEEEKNSWFLSHIFYLIATTYKHAYIAYTSFCFTLNYPQKSLMWGFHGNGPSNQQCILEFPHTWIRTIHHKRKWSYIRFVRVLFSMVLHINTQNYADRFWTATQSHKMAHWLRSIHANIRRNRTSEEDEKKNCRHNNYTVHRQCHVGESVCMYVRLCVRDDRCVHCPNNTHTYIWICRFLGNIIQLKKSARSKNDKLTLYRREKKEKEEEDEEYNDSLNKIGFENEVSKMGYAQL